MKIWSWNIKGLRKQDAVTILHDLVKLHTQDIVVLIETLANNAQMEDIRIKIGFAGCITLEAIGHSGGLAILWRSATPRTLLSLHRQCITSRCSFVFFLLGTSNTFLVSSLIFIYIYMSIHIAFCSSCLLCFPFRYSNFVGE
ncbi:hypothetical protein LINGRAHAP2_LOCUS13762 [Linum grandiflorum]